MIKRSILATVTLLAVDVSEIEAVRAAEEPFTRVRPYNLSSHLPAFFRDLLSGRVWVYKRRGAIAALYFAKDGQLFGCWKSKDRPRFQRSLSSMRWKIGTPNGISNLEINWATPEGLRFYRMVIVYDGKSGRFHGERFRISDRRWFVARDGWVQRSWPKVLAAQCRGLLLPWDLAIDGRQVSTDFEAAKSMATPVRKHPGWRLSFPGATGLGASGGNPTLTLAEVIAIKEAAHGKISIGMSGERRVSVAWPDYTEVWALDENDNIVDLAKSRRIRDGSIMVGRWERSGRINSYHIGYPFPLVITDELHPAFRMMDDVVAKGAPIALQTAALDEGSYVFLRDGAVRGPAGAGKWWLSRGAVYLKFGERETNFGWKQFAVLAGLSGG